MTFLCRSLPDLQKVWIFTTASTVFFSLNIRIP